MRMVTQFVLMALFVLLLAGSAVGDDGDGDGEYSDETPVMQVEAMR